MTTLTIGCGKKVQLIATRSFPGGRELEYVMPISSEDVDLTTQEERTFVCPLCGSRGFEKDWRG